MKCNHSGCGVVLALAILIVTVFPTIFSAMVNKWIIIVAAVLLLLCAAKCGAGACAVKPMKAAPRARKARRKKRR